MKLRLKGNSIRLRLLRSEVERFAIEGLIAEQTSFGPNTFRYSLAISPNGKEIYSEFENNEIKVFIPHLRARDWATSNEVGLEAEQQIGDNDVLTILVEKDFACLDRPDDPDRDDAFPNPAFDCKP